MIKSTPHILVIDDDKLILKQIEFMLINSGCRLTLVSSGEEALKKSKKVHFDLIISDLYMPSMSGSELVQYFRSTAEYKYVPIVMLSANSEEEVSSKNINAGADDFISKPIQQKLFLSKINAHLRRAFLRRDIISEAQKSDVSYKKGTVIYCANPKFTFSLLQQDILTDIQIVFNESDLFKQLQEGHIWGLIVDNSAEWITHTREKVKNLIDKELPIIFLVEDMNYEPISSKLLQFKSSTFISKQLKRELLLHQINASIQREIDLKNKYINALNTAAKRSPIRFNNEYAEDFNNYGIHILHEAYNKLPGGDYYEVIEVTPTSKIIIMGDIMGKKWDAWFFVSAYIAYIRSTINFFLKQQEIDFVHQPGKLLYIINQYVLKDMQLTEVFTTLNVVGICTKSNKVSVASAGGLRPYIYRQKEDGMSQLNILGTLLGVIPDAEYRSLTVSFKKGDKLALYTDGYSEAIDNNKNNMIGEQALFEALYKYRVAKKVKPKAIDSSIQKSHNITKFDDDRTLVIIERYE